MTNHTTPATVSKEKYLKLEKQYRKLFQAVESSPASVIITHPCGTIEYTNPKFTEITGYSAEEVKGKNPRLLKSGQTPPEVFADLWQTIKKGEQWRGELINRKKDGSLYREFAAISPVLDERGAIINFVAVKLDITAQKEAEEEKEKIHAFLQMVIDAVPEGIMVIDRDYRIKLMNKVIRDGLPPELVNSELHCYQASHHQETPCSGVDHPCPLLTVTKSQQTENMLHQHWTNSGERRYVELVAAPLFAENGEIAGIIESGRDVTVRKLGEEKLEYLAHYDPLTNIPNRVIYFERLRQAIANAKEKNIHFGVLYVDLDGFKEVNDTLGHRVGDLLLQNTAKRVSGCIRQGDTVARMGGDEFALILNPLKSREDAILVARKIQTRLAEVFNLENHPCRILASVGVGFYPEDGDSAEELLKHADEAMYQEKRSRKSQK